jgi:D-3-phosphoglycerate dehydrogenase
MAEHIAHAPNLWVLARYGVGVDSVDLAAARDHGVVVTNAPGANSDVVADFSVTLLFAVLRGITTGDRRARRALTGVSQARRRGTERWLGRARAHRAAGLSPLTGFGCHALVADPYVADAGFAGFGAERTTFEEMAAR